MDIIVEIKPSTIPDIGMGAFALEEFRRKEILGKYEGRRISAKYYQKLKEDNEPLRYAYVFEANINGKKIFIDAYDPKYSNWCRYINHYPDDGEPNVEFTEDGKIVALRYIYPGEELFIDYGHEYWKLFDGKK